MADEETGGEGSSPSPEIITEARKMGWVAKEQFRGDPARWTDAESFVTRGRELMPILQANNRRLQDELDGVRRQVGEANEALTALKEYHSTATKAAYDKALRDLKAEKVEALRDGKFESVVELDEAIDKLGKAEPKPTGTPAAKPTDLTQDPIYKGWASEHPWLGVDADKTAYATGMAQYVRATEKALTGRPFLDRVAELVEERYPSGGSSQGEAPTSKVEGGSRGTSGRTKTFASLPQEAKDACDRFGAKLVGQGKAYKNLTEWRNQYVADYAWD